VTISQVPNADALRRLLGKTVLFKNQRFRVTEVLDRELSLVLESLDQIEIQADQHGRAARHSPTHLIVNALDELQLGPSRDLMSLQILD
jgi:hypothetical protein